jgi:hypothetical protein
VIDERDPQDKKHDEQRSSTLRGITIDRGDESDNASDSIRVNLESDSNVIRGNILASKTLMRHIQIRVI